MIPFVRWPLPILALGMLGIAVAHGAERIGADFPVAEGGGTQGAPAAIHDPAGDRFFVAWYDYRSGRAAALEIYGRLADGVGRPVTGDIPVARAARSQSSPAVALDTVNRRFLVLWADWRDAINVDSDIYGRLFEADGSPYGEEFIVAARRGVSQKTPTLAFDPVRQRFLVLWKDSRHPNGDKTYGRFVGADGAPQGDEFPIAVDGDSQDGPSVLFDPRKKQFLAAWRDVRSVGVDMSEKAVIGSFIDAEKGPSGKSFVIAQEKTDSRPLSQRAVSFSPNHDSYFIVWTSGRNYSETQPGPARNDDRSKKLDVYGAFIGADDGSLRGEPIAIASEVDHQEMPSVAHDSTRDRFLVVWSDSRRRRTSGQSGIYGRYVTPQGDMSGEFLISDERASGPRQLPTVAFSPNSAAFLVLWEDSRQGRGTGTRVYGATVR